MIRQVALLRAVNVGGTGALPMADLRAMGEACGFAGVRTHIASGNLLFASAEPEEGVRARLEACLAAYAGKRVDVFVRTHAELAAIIAANPFPDVPGNRHMVVFLADPVPPDLIARCRNAAGERLTLGRRELHVAYPEGAGNSRLRIPIAPASTARNFNTVTALARLLAA